MKRIILILLAIYGGSACCQGLQIRSDHADVSKIDGRAVTVESWGSGCYLTKHLVLTCYHVLAEGTSHYVKTPKGGWIVGRSFAFDKENDLALLYTDEEGEPVELASIPPLSISGSQKNEPTKDHKAELNNAIIKADVDCGSSGSPVLADGRLIGMVKMKFTIKNDPLMENGVYAVIASVDVIARLLK